MSRTDKGSSEASFEVGGDERAGLRPCLQLQQAVFVTGNPDKLVEARRLCGERLSSIDLDLPEIQSLDIVEVLQHKADAASTLVKGPFVVEETGLDLAAMNGFPGALVKWMLVSTGAETLANIAGLLGDKRATARCCLLYRDGARSVLGHGSTNGTLVLPPRGSHGFGWDPVFIPEGETRTYAELEPAHKDRLSHRGRAWRDLRERIAALPG
ncbi:MAG: non-canonical purine NTP pyrophosphatase [Acidobacteriota bacterium]